MKTKRHKGLEYELKHVETVNKLSPFPLFDTEYVSMLKEQLKLINKIYES